MADPTVTISIVMAAQAALLACISRLRFRCVPDENGRCVVSSGCSEVPLPGADEEDIVTHMYDLNGRNALIVTARGSEKT